jgi:hypothetical protein
VCEEQVEELKELQDVNGEDRTKSARTMKGEIVGDHYWTVISR